MRIIDFHTHIYPDAIARKAADTISQFYVLDGDNMDGTAATLLERGRQAGIDHFVVLPVGLKPGHVRHINEFIIGQVAEHPQFTGFGTIHAGMEGLVEEVEFIHSSGLRGVKMHPDTQLFNIDDPRLFPAYERMRELDLPVMLHTGDSRYDFSHPRRLRHILTLFPGLKAIGAHFGGYSVYEAALDALRDMDCFLDVSSSLMFLDRDTAVDYIRKYGAERMLFGSDYPLWDPATEIQRFLSLGLRDDEVEQIAHRTAEDLLGI